MSSALTMTRDLLASRALRWIVAAAIASTIAIYLFTDARNLLTIESVRDLQSWFAQSFERSPIIVSLAFFAMFTAVSAISMPGAAALMLIAGSSFGLIWGTLLSTFASALGATIAMLATRFLFRDWINARYGARLADMNRGIEKNGLYYLFSLRVAPVIPYFILNWLSGLTRLRVWPFFSVSFLGMLPGTAVYVNAGNELAKINSFADIFSWQVIVSFVLIAITPFLLKFAIEKINTLTSRAQ